jgi:hypothetical protein
MLVGVDSTTINSQQTVGICPNRKQKLLQKTMIIPVLVLPSGKGNGAFWSDHGKTFVVTCSWGRGEMYRGKKNGRITNS